MAGLGNIRTLFSFKFNSNTFKATSPINNFTHTSLLKLDSGTVNQEELKAIFITPLGRLTFNGKYKDGKIDGFLYNKKGTLSGKITGTRTISDVPLANYPQIVDSILSLLRKNLYDASLLQKSDWDVFAEGLKASSKQMNDDADIIFATYFLGQRLSFSHVSLAKELKDLKIPDIVSGSKYQLDSLQPGVLYLKILSFEGTRILIAYLRLFFKRIQKK